MIIDVIPTIFTRIKMAKVYIIIIILLSKVILKVYETVVLILKILAITVILRHNVIYNKL